MVQHWIMCVKRRRGKKKKRRRQMVRGNRGKVDTRGHGQRRGNIDTDDNYENCDPDEEAIDKSKLEYILANPDKFDFGSRFIKGKKIDKNAQLVLNYLSRTNKKENV